MIMASVMSGTSGVAVFMFRRKYARIDSVMKRHVFLSMVVSNCPLVSFFPEDNQRSYDATHYHQPDEHPQRRGCCRFRNGFSR